MNKKMLLIGGGLVVLLAAGGGAAYYFGLFGGEEEVEAAEPVELVPGLLELEPFLTNIADERGDHAARLRVKLVVAPAESLPEIQADPLRLARLRDQILTLLAARTYDELKSVEGKEMFRSELQQALEPHFEDVELREVLFGDFIVQ